MKTKAATRGRRLAQSAAPRRAQKLARAVPGAVWTMRTSSGEKRDLWVVDVDGDAVTLEAIVLGEPIRFCCPSTALGGPHTWPVVALAS